MSKEKTLRIAPDQIQRVIDRRYKVFPDKKNPEVYNNFLNVSKTTYYKFIGGEGIGEHNFHHICFRLGFNENEIKEIGIPGHLSLDEPEAGLPFDIIPLDRSLALPSSKGLSLATLSTESSYQIEFVSYVAERTWKFVGRNYVFHEIERFFSRNKNGFFIVVGEPGQGKTAILSKYADHPIQNTVCIAYFNIRNQGKDQVNKCLSSICKSLVTRFRIENYKIPITFSDSSTLDELLQIASNRLNNKRLVIVIDALDEVDLSSQGKHSNILFLPQTFPENVYFLLSRRPYDEMKERLASSVPQTYFDLRENYLEEAIDDIKEYVQKFLDDREYKDAIDDWISNQPNLTKDEFIRILSEEKSESNFMYVKQVMTDIANGNLDSMEVNKLPKGLMQYYNSHWQLMGMDEMPLLSKKFEVMYVLARERYIASSYVIANIVEEVSELYVETVLGEWIQFLRIIPEIDETLCYGIYHYSFNEFLLDIAKKLPKEQIKSLEARRVRNPLRKPNH